MRIHVRSRKIDVSDELKGFIAGRLTRALNRFEDRIRDVSVLITDTNGPKGGTDKLMRIRVLISGCERVVLTVFGSNLSLMVDNAAGRMKARLSSTIARARHFDARQKICKELVA
jgi:ribosome-associated translation inhibitor RaiA